MSIADPHDQNAGVPRGPLRQAPLFHAGMRFVRPDAETWANGAPAGKRDKAARRVLRRQLMIRRSFQKKVLHAQRELEDAKALAADRSNSHARRRNAEAFISERRNARDQGFYAP